MKMKRACGVVIAVVLLALALGAQERPRHRGEIEQLPPGSPLPIDEAVKRGVNLPHVGEPGASASPFKVGERVGLEPTGINRSALNSNNSEEIANSGYSLGWESIETYREAMSGMSGAREHEMRINGEMIQLPIYVDGGALQQRRAAYTIVQVGQRAGRRQEGEDGPGFLAGGSKSPAASGLGARGVDF